MMTALTAALTRSLHAAETAHAISAARRYRLAWLSAWRGRRKAIAERDRARATAVRLEQELAQVREEIARDIEANKNHDAVRNATLATAARIARGGAA